MGHTYPEEDFHETMVGSICILPDLDSFGLQPTP